MEFTRSPHVCMSTFVYCVAPEMQSDGRVTLDGMPLASGIVHSMPKHKRVYVKLLARRIRTINTWWIRACALEPD